MTETVSGFFFSCVLSGKNPLVQLLAASEFQEKFIQGHHFSLKLWKQWTLSVLVSGDIWDLGTFLDNFSIPVIFGPLTVLYAPSHFLARNIQNSYSYFFLYSCLTFLNNFFISLMYWWMLTSFLISNLVHLYFPFFDQIYVALTMF